MDDEELRYLTATEAAATFRAKKVSPAEVLEAQIARAEATADTINAFTYRHFEEAREAARAAEARFMRGEPLGPLDGLTVAIKDESFIAGKPTSNGSLLMKDFVPETTTPINERILAAGAIVHARTATPEFSCAAVTWSRLWGVTRNPWNLAMTPGGSSGGSAAALAAGMTTLATGSDIGGSIRIPASCCGLVGYKPPYGRNPDDPPFNLDFFCHTGPLARSVGDAILLQNVMCGPHPRDIAAIHPKLTLPREYPSARGMRVAYSPDLGAFAVDAQVRRNTEGALATLRDLGAVVEEVDVGWGAEALDAPMAYLAHLFGGYLAKMADGRGDEMTTYARAFAAMSRESTSRDFVAALEAIGEMHLTFGPLMENYDVLVCPANGLPAVAADFDPSRDTVEIAGRQVRPELGWMLTTPFNALSRCPVLSVPTGFAKNGVPTGMQIVGRPYRDEDVFRAGLAFEAAAGGWLGAGARPAPPA